LMKEHGGELTPQILEQLEAEERSRDENERRERKAKTDQAEKRLKELNAKIKAQEKMNEERYVKALQHQLELMESKLQKLETGQYSKGSDEIDFEKIDELLMARAKMSEEEMRLYKERQEELNKRKNEMDNRLKELHGTLLKKRTLCSKKELDQKQDQINKLEATLRGIDTTEAKTAKMSKGPSIPEINEELFEGMALSPSDKKFAKVVEERLSALEDQMQKKREESDLLQEEIKKRQEMLNSLDTKLKQFNDISSVMNQLSKIDKLQNMYDQLNSKIADGNFKMGSSSGSIRDAETLKAEIAELQGIIFNEKSSEKEIAEANVKLEKAIQEYEQTSEYKDAKEKKQREQDALNKDALEKVRSDMQKLSPEAFKQRLLENNALKLLAMNPDLILKLHQNDFKNFMLSNLSVLELRALRGCLPNFRPDQTIQRGFVESLEYKIEEKAANQNKPAPPPPIKPKAAVALKPKMTKASKRKSVAAVSGDLMAEIRARAKN